MGLTTSEKLQATFYLIACIACLAVLYTMITFLQDGPSVDRQLADSHVIESIEFKMDKSPERSNTYIETENDVKVIATNRITFKTGETDKSLQMDTLRYDESYWLHDHFKDEFVLHVPENQQKELSKAYADAYAETLVWDE